VRDVLDRAVGGQRPLLVLAAEQRELDLLALVLVGVVLHAAQASGYRLKPWVVLAVSAVNAVLVCDGCAIGTSADRVTSDSGRQRIAATPNNSAGTNTSPDQCRSSQSIVCRGAEHPKTVVSGATSDLDSGYHDDTREAGLPATTTDWKAWIDTMPGPGAKPTLHVTGECMFESSGHTVTLERQQPQGINPRDLLLRLIVHEPAEPGNMREHLRVEYSEPAAADQYDTVSILPDGPLSIPVETAS
jgi:hypothetical protein